MDTSGSESESEGHPKMTNYTASAMVAPQLNSYPTLGATGMGQPLYQAPGSILHDYQTLWQWLTVPTDTIHNSI